MKKIFTVFILLFVLSSCGGEAEETLPLEYDADISISIGEKEYAAIYGKRNGFDKLTFVSPESFVGLTLTLQGGIATVKMGDMTFESESLARMFDFLPIAAEGTKNAGNREYRIYNIRGLE